MFHSEKAQPRMKGLKLKNFHNLVELLSAKNNDMETQVSLLLEANILNIEDLLMQTLFQFLIL